MTASSRDTSFVVRSMDNLSWAHTARGLMKMASMSLITNLLVSQTVSRVLLAVIMHRDSLVL